MKQEIKHTPGPWKADCANEIVPDIESPEPHQHIACAYDFKRDKDEAKANARLIASAPELLEALETISNLIPIARLYFPKSIHNSEKFHLELACAEVGKAISKAKGNL